MRAVFDLDDTICKNVQANFANATPIEKTIKKIAQLKKSGWEIVIHTARGQDSCKGDIARIEEKYRANIESWLKNNGVLFDQLIFGKPLADIYVDDKSVALEDFLKDDYRELSGNSNSAVYKIGSKVVKNCKNAAEQAAWYFTAKENGANVPKVYSRVLDTIILDYIDGETGDSRKISQADISRLFGVILPFSFAKEGYSFDVTKLWDRVTEHLSSRNYNEGFRRLKDFIISNKEEYAGKASFCHGDFSLSNVIFTDRAIFLIDPIVSKEYSSYLLDFAKLRFSLDGGEKFLHGKENETYPEILIYYDRIISELASIEKIKALEATYWLRLLKYTDNEAAANCVIEKAKWLEASL